MLKDCWPFDCDFIHMALVFNSNKFGISKSCVRLAKPFSQTYNKIALETGKYLLTRILGIGNVCLLISKLYNLKCIICLFIIPRKLGYRVRSKDVRHRRNLIQCHWMWVMIFTDDRHWKLGPPLFFGWVGVLVECVKPILQATDPTGNRRPTETTVNWATSDVARFRYYDVSYSRLFLWPDRRRNMCFSAFSIDQLLRLKY